MKKQKIELIVPAAFQFSSLVREVAGSICVLTGLADEWSGRLKLVMDEIFNNAVEYGSDETSQVYVTFFFDESEISFQIEDEGKGPKKVYPLELSAVVKKNLEELEHSEKDGGRGLALISRLWADQLRMENSPRGGLLIGFKKTIIRDSKS